MDFGGGQQQEPEVQYFNICLNKKTLPVSKPPRGDFVKESSSCEKNKNYPLQHVRNDCYKSRTTWKKTKENSFNIVKISSATWTISDFPNYFSIGE